MKKCQLLSYIDQYNCVTQLYDLYHALTVMESLLHSKFVCGLLLNLVLIILQNSSLHFTICRPLFLIQIRRYEQSTVII